MRIGHIEGDQMKKFLTLLLVVAMVVLSGCKEDTSNTWVPEEFNSERFIYSSRMYGQLMRYDIVDRKATIACPDPMCKHGANCLVTNIKFSYVGNDHILYGRMENGVLGGYTMYSLDLKEGRIVKILDCPRFQDITFIEDFAIFTASHVVYNEDGSVKGEVWDVYKFFLERNELIKINSESLNGELVVYDFNDESILWLDYYGYSGYSFFKTDYDFNNMTPSDYYIRIKQYDYLITNDYAEDGTITFNISRKNVNNGVIEQLLTDVTSYRLDNSDDPKGIVYNSYTEDGGKDVIRYIDLSDLSTKKLTDLPKGYTFTEDIVFPNTGTSLYANGYVGVYVTYSNHEHSDSHNSNTMFFVNIYTGDSFIISP